MDWYEEDVKAVLEHRNSIRYQPETIFYGSSTIRLWDTLYEDFKQFKPINLGFGGSTLAACAWYFDEIVGPLIRPQRLFVYAGDNDLGDGRHPEEVCLFYRQFVAALRSRFKKIPCYFISIKPSIERQEIMENIILANTLIEKEIATSNGTEIFVNVFDAMLTKKGTPAKKYFDEDGLHLHKRGYDVLKTIILNEYLVNK